MKTWLFVVPKLASWHIFSFIGIVYTSSFSYFSLAKVPIKQEFDLFLASCCVSNYEIERSFAKTELAYIRYLYEISFDFSGLPDFIEIWVNLRYIQGQYWGQLLFGILLQYRLTWFPRRWTNQNGLEFVFLLFWHFIDSKYVARFNLFLTVSINSFMARIVSYPYLKILAQTSQNVKKLKYDNYWKYLSSKIILYDMKTNL